jgi:hypothetical protein
MKYKKAGMVSGAAGLIGEWLVACMQHRVRTPLLISSVNNRLGVIQFVIETLRFGEFILFSYRLC